MRKVELVPGIGSSVLGFGCAPILGAVGAKDAERALGTAFDAGITHYDVARSYGYGEAEKFLGRFLRGRRDQVVLASKFGIRATWRAHLARPLKPVVRMLRGRRTPVPVSEAPAPTQPRRDPFHEHIEITASNMERNLEETLRALRTDHLDLYFVHEPVQPVRDPDAVLACASRLQREGKIRGFGVAFSWETRGRLAQLLDGAGVWQFGCSPGFSDYEEMRQERADGGNVLFSALSRRGERTVEQTLLQLWRDFPRSVVLCSMFNPNHILSNARLAAGG